MSVQDSASNGFAMMTILAGEEGFLLYLRLAIEAFPEPIRLAIESTMKPLLLLFLLVSTGVAEPHLPEGTKALPSAAERGRGPLALVNLNLKTEMAEGESAAVIGPTRLPASRVASSY
jgi:hypothetical protein